MEEGLRLLIDLHLDGERQGPGGSAETRLAIGLSGLSGRSGLRIADVGCGTGASTRVLARELDAEITAIDLSPAFLDRLAAISRREGLGERIATQAAPMEALPFDAGSLDAIWSEGAIYNMGFANGVRSWLRFLKPGGVLAVSELTWLTVERPPALQNHWAQEYPEVDTAAGKIAILEQNGFTPIGYFPLPGHCWLENYYRPLEARFADFLKRNADSPSARAIVEAERHEIDIYERHSAFFGYGFYLARRNSD